MTPSSSRNVCRYSVIRSIIWRHRATVCRYSLPLHTPTHIHVASISSLTYRISSLHQYFTNIQRLNAASNLSQHDFTIPTNIFHSTLLLGVFSAKSRIKNNFQLECFSHTEQADGQLRPQPRLCTATMHYINNCHLPLTRQLELERTASSSV